MWKHSEKRRRQQEQAKRGVLILAYEAAWPQLSYLSELLIGRDYEVTIATRYCLPALDLPSGVALHLIKHGVFRWTKFSRFDLLSFAVTFVRSLLWLRSSTVITLDPISLCVTELLRCFRRQIRHIHYCIEQPLMTVNSRFGLAKNSARILFPRVKAVIFPNSHRAQATETLAPGTTARVMPNSPTRRAAMEWRGVAARQIPQRNGRRVVLYHGELGSSHYIFEICQASHLLPPGIMIAIIGRVQQGQEEVVRRALEGADPDKLKYFGFQQRNELPAWRNAADLMITFWSDLNETTWLCAPNKLYEAIASGVPLITSRNPTLLEVVEKFGLGLCIDPSDPSNIAAAIEKAMFGGDLTKMGSRCKELFESSLNLDIAATPVLDELFPTLDVS